MPNKLPVRLFNVKSMETVIHHDFPKSVFESGYAAVSHVWGEQTLHNPDDLDVKNGVNWKVPLSDTRKMDMLKNAMKKFKMEWCWWDVLCMPQDKQDEINKEIPHMGDYYNGAKMTLVLSDKEESDENTFTTGLARGFATITKHTSVVLQVLWLELQEEPWLERLWTFQEAVMSKQIWLITLRGTYLDVSDVMKRMASSSETFGNRDEVRPVVNLARAIRDYNNHKTSVGRMLYECRNRECYKPEDKFYGTLGVLGYTNFPVTYGIDMRDLMKTFMEHAYYNGDVSWLAVHVNGETGFIPSHENLEYIGELWREEIPGSCNIKFTEDTLFINACMVANVTHTQEIVNGNRKLYDTYEKWGFSDSDATRCIIGYCKLSDEEVREFKWFREVHKDNMVSLATMKGIGSFVVGGNTGKLFAKHLQYSDTNWKVVSKVVCIKTGKCVLIIVCGECDIGDRIMLLPMHDSHERMLGIVVDDKFRRKGICLYPRLDMHYEYTPQEFPL
jgi:hypothetical protein